VTIFVKEGNILVTIFYYFNGSEHALLLFISYGLFGSLISISAILKIMFLKSSLFKVAQMFGKTC
jgi:hypothetical protein